MSLGKDFFFYPAAFRFRSVVTSLESGLRVFQRRVQHKKRIRTSDPNWADLDPKVCEAAYMLGQRSDARIMNGQASSGSIFKG